MNTKTAEQMRDYYDWHVQNGRGNHGAFLDRRGLQYFDTKIHENIAIGVPPDGETHGDGVVYVRAIF